MVRDIKSRENLEYSILPKFQRTIGKYSFENRDFEKEKTLKEPDPDKPEQWLSDQMRNDPQFMNECDETWDKWTSHPQGWKPSEGEILWVGQSHIDIAWEWRIAQTIDKSRVTYQKAVFHMDHIPEFTFAGSQALTYECVRQRDPALFKKIQEYQKRGRFELVGGSWVEPDCRMPSGEGFIRQRLYGQHFFLKHFNTLPSVEWTPDTFGYAWSMPQIIRKSGGNSFFTTKIWDNHPKHLDAPWPYVNFNWRGPDGSEVLTHIQPQMFGPIPEWPNSKQKSKLVKEGITLITDYNTQTPQNHPDLSSNPNDYVKEMGVFAGLGDGGHGPTGKEVAQIDRWMKKGYGKYSTVHNYFAILNSYHDRLPIWNDELYYQYHQGTLTSQGFVKHWIRALEMRTAGIEALSTIIEMIGGPIIDYAAITQVWLDICTNHFHDIFPGSSIAEVYDDFYDYVAQDNEILNRIQTQLFDWIAASTPMPKIPSKIMPKIQFPFIATNSLNNNRYSIVSIPIDKEFGTKIQSAIIRTGDGELIVPAQFIPGDPEIDDQLVALPDRVEFLLDFKGYEWVIGYLTDISCPSENKMQVQITDEIIQIKSDSFKCTIDKDSALISSYKWLVDAQSEKELFSAPAFELKAFEDMENVWEIQHDFRENPIPFEVISKPIIRENGPVRIVVEYQSQIEDMDSIFTHRYLFYNNLTEIRTELLVDWKDPGLVIKQFYPITTESERSYAEIPAAVISRLTHPITAHDKARWENNCQTFVDMPSKDQSWGIAFLNDGKYGYATPDSGFELTLLRKGRLPKIADEAWCLPSRKEKVLKGEYVPTTADDGWHVIRQAIIPHLGNWEDNNLNHIAHAFNTLILAQIITEPSQKSKQFSKPSEPFISISNPHLELIALKPWEPLIANSKPGYIIRIVNYSCSMQEGLINFNPILAVESIQGTDLLERPNTIEGEAPYQFDKTNSQLITKWKPFEIRTFLVN